MDYISEVDKKLKPLLDIDMPLQFRTFLKEHEAEANKLYQQGYDFFEESQKEYNERSDKKTEYPCEAAVGFTRSGSQTNMNQYGFAVGNAERIVTYNGFYGSQGAAHNAGEASYAINSALSGIAHASGKQSTAIADEAQSMAIDLGNQGMSIGLNQGNIAIMAGSDGKAVTLEQRSIAINNNYGENGNVAALNEHSISVGINCKESCAEGPGSIAALSGYNRSHIDTFGEGSIAMSTSEGIIIKADDVQSIAIGTGSNSNIRADSANSVSAGTGFSDVISAIGYDEVAIAVGTGDESQVVTNHGIAVASGKDTLVMGDTIGSLLIAVERNENGEIISTAMGMIDNITLHDHHFYRCKAGKLVDVEEDEEGV